MVKRKKRVKKPPKKPWTRRYATDPWNDTNVKLELYISPALQLRLGLPRHIVENPEEEE